MATTSAEQLERNKKCIGRFFAAFNQGGFDAALALLHAKATWWTPAATYNKDQMIELGHLLESQCTTGLRFTLVSLTAEGDTVAAEAQSSALRKNGVRYANQYCYLFRFSEGAIVEVREHCNTQHAMEVWSDLMGGAAPPG